LAGLVPKTTDVSKRKAIEGLQTLVNCSIGDDKTDDLRVDPRVVLEYITNPLMKLRIVVKYINILSRGWSLGVGYCSIYLSHGKV